MSGILSRRSEYYIIDIFSKEMWMVVSMSETSSTPKGMHRADCILYGTIATIINAHHLINYLIWSILFNPELNVTFKLLVNETITPPYFLVSPSILFFWWVFNVSTMSRLTPAE